MAEVKLTVRTNFTEAEKELQKLGGTVQTTMKSMTDAEKALASKNIDQYLDKQSRLSTAMSLTRGQAESNIVQQRNLRNEYEKLYRQGIDPTSAGMIKLENQYRNVTAAVDANAQATKTNEIAMAAMSRAGLAAVAAVGAVTTAYIANTVAVAQQVDAMSEQASSLGMTTQEYQSLAFVAERTGASMEGMDKAIQKMNIGIGQARDGSGQLYDVLSKQNPALLSQVTNAESSADAFALLADAIGNTKNPYDRAALASVAFGKGNREIINTAIAGGESISSLIAESERYGIVSESLVQKSDQFDDSQKNLSAAFMGVRYALAEKLMPALTMGMQGIADFVSNGDKMKLLMTAAVPLLAGLTTGLIAYGIATKGQAIVTAALTTATWALNAAMAINPAVWVAAAIVALIAVIVMVRKNWDTVVWAWTLGVNAMKIVLGDLVLMVADKFIPIVLKIYETLGKIPVVGKIYQAIGDGIEAVTEKVKASTLAMQENAEASIRAADDKYEAAKKAAEAEKVVANSMAGGSSTANMADIAGRNSGTASKAKASSAKVEEETIGTAKELTALQDKLMLFENTEAVHKQRSLEQYDQFYTARMGQEQVAASDQIAFLESEQQRILAMKILTKDEEIRLEEATEAKKLEIQKANAEAAYQLQKQRISNVGGFFNDLQTIAKNTGKESRALAIILKGIALAEIGMNTARSVMASAAMGYPQAIPFIAMSVASGVAAASSVVAQKLPSAETGIRDFTVPDSTRVDSSFLKVNRDEKVTVTPRGESNTRMQQTSVFLDGKVLLKSFQEFIDNGSLRITADNIVGAF